MALPSTTTFYLGLFLIVIGTGLLKGNVSVIVGALYGKDDIRRDAGFSIFYMGINLGAFIAPLVCGYLGQKISWHAGFAAAGFGMVIGVIQYVLGRPVPRRRRLVPGAGGVAGAGARLRRNAHRSGAIVAGRCGRRRSPSASYTGALRHHGRSRSPTGPAYAAC